MEGSIELLGMEFHAFHGCLEEERREGNTFIVDVKVAYDFSAAAQSDDLSDTMDYGLVYDIVSECMGVPSNLLENVAWRIATSIRDAVPGALGVKVSVAKKNPPVNGPAAWSKVNVEL